MKKGKKFLIALLFLLALGITGTSLAYWAGVINVEDKNSDLSVLVGEGETIETEINVDSVSDLDGKKLVPSTIVPTEFESTKASFQVSFTWTGNAQASGAQGILSLSIENKKIGDTPDDSNEAYDDTITLITITIFESDGETVFVPANIEYGATINVVITVQFSEPATKAQYEIIAGNTIHFTLVSQINVI